MSVKISVLVPYRGHSQHWRAVRSLTDKAWADALEAARDIDVEVVVGEQVVPGPMHVAWCVNEAAAHASGDVFVLWGADHWPDVARLRWLIDALDDGRAWSPLFEATGIVDRRVTQRLINKRAVMPDTVPFEVVAPLCVGIFAVTRDAFFSVGGEDERFIGWGMEDAALRHTLTVLYGDPGLPETGSTLKALWHPVQSHDDAYAQANVALYHDKYLACGDDKDMLETTLLQARRSRATHGQPFRS